jgi:hypothetical protein
MQTRQSGVEWVAHGGRLSWSPGQDGVKSQDGVQIQDGVKVQDAVQIQDGVQSAVDRDDAGCLPCQVKETHYTRKRGWLPGQDAVQGGVHRDAERRWWEEEGRRASKNLEMSHQLLKL